MTTVITMPRMLTSREQIESLFEAAPESGTYSVVLTNVFAATPEVCDEIVLQSLVARGASTLMVQGGYASLRQQITDAAARHGVPERLWLR